MKLMISFYGVTSIYLPVEKHHQFSEFWVQLTHFTVANNISNRRNLHLSDDKADAVPGGGEALGMLGPSCAEWARRGRLVKRTVWTRLRAEPCVVNTDSEVSDGNAAFSSHVI